MDINDEIRRRRLSARETDAMWHAQQDHARTELAVTQAAIRVLGVKFVRWAEMAGIAPERHSGAGVTYRTGWLRRRPPARQVIPPYGWTLRRLGTLTGNCDSGFCGPNHSHSIGLIVSMTGSVAWQTNSDLFTPPALTPEYVESCIVDYIVRSGSLVPWPEDKLGYSDHGWV